MLPRPRASCTQDQELHRLMVMNAEEALSARGGEEMTQTWASLSAFAASSGETGLM